MIENFDRLLYFKYKCKLLFITNLLIINKINKMHNGSDDDDEGFVPNKIQIKHKEIKPNNKEASSNSILNNVYEPKYLSGDGLLWKQPPQSQQSFYECPIYHENKNQKPKKHKVDQQNCYHPYYLYMNSQKYDLIYSRRRRDPFSLNENQFMKNQVSLKNLASEDPYRLLKPFQNTPPKTITSQILQLDSRFQSGNLYCAFKQHAKNSYILFIQNDTNTLGYNQWFYFSIKNAKPGITYHFEIVNFVYIMQKKKHSIFRYGYKMAIFSLLKSQTDATGWYRDGYNIIYGDSTIMNPAKPDVKYYSLSFDLQFQNKNDYYMVAMNLPYSYSKLITNLQVCQKRARKNQISWKMEKVATTLCGNDVPEITIQIPSSEKKQEKQMIIIMARQHSGETWSSYMMQGFLNKISQGGQEVKQLLQNFTIRVYPMVNVDGVIYGNFRCDITGVDLNRRWKNPSSLLNSQIFSIKKAIKDASKSYNIVCCYDLHGHSKDYNIFCYSCKQNMNTCRALPYLISKINSNFYFPSCTFGLSKYKLTTARAAIFKIIKTQNVLTIQNSFYGYKSQNEVKHFQPKHLFQMAESILQATKKFFDKKSNLKQTITNQIKDNIKQLTKYENVNDEDSGSDSQPECDEIQFQQKARNIFPQQFISQAIHFIIERKHTQKKMPIIQQKQIKNPTMPIKKTSKTIETKSKIINFNNNKVTENKSQNLTFRAERKKISSPRTANTIQHKNQTSVQRKYSTIKKLKSPQENIQRQSKYMFRHRRNLLEMTLNNKQPTKQQQNKQSIEFIKPQIKPIFEITQLLVHQNTHKSSQEKQQISKSNQLKQKLKKMMDDTKRQKKKALKLDFLEQTIYNQDQSGMINVLLQNKRRIQLEKIRRQVQKSTGIVQRQGKSRQTTRANQTAIDFRKFRQKSRSNYHNLKYNQNPRYIQNPTNWQNFI